MIVLLWVQPLQGPPCPSANSSLPQLLTDSQALQERGDPGPAASCFALAAERAAAANEPLTEARARLGLAQTSLEIAAYDRGTEEARRARALYERERDELGVARADATLASAAVMTGQRARGTTLYRAVIEEFRRLGADRERANAIVSYTMAADLPHDAEMALLDEAIAIARRLGLRRIEARALHSRADKQFSEGRFDDAVRDLGAAIELFQSENRQASLADAYVSLGRIHRAHGQPETAIGYYDQAIAIHERIGDLRGVVQSTNAKAIALGAAGRLPEARAAYERALEVARTTGSPRLINFQQGNLAGAYADAGDHATAIRLLEDVLTREIDPYVLAYRHSGLAHNYLAVGTPERAIEHAHQSIKFAEQTSNRELLPALLLTRAEVYRALGRRSNALADAQASTRVIEEMRAKLVPLDFMKRGFSNRNQEVFSLTIALMHERGEDGRSLVVSEQARARAFLDLLASRSLVTQPVAPIAVPVASARADASLASATAATPVSGDEIARIAARLQSTILSYWVDPEGIQIWTVSPGAPVQSARVVVKREELERAVTASIPTPMGADLEALGQLYRWLIAPVARGLPPSGAALTIIPHGPLFHVSFAALRDARGRYLIEDYALGYSPSISAFLYTQRLADVSRGRPASYLLVADPSPLPRGTDAPPLFALPASLREAEGIRRVLGPSASSLVLTRRRATESLVRKAMGGRRIIHFATHAFIRDDEPFESFLALGVSGKGAAEDGRLSVRELYDIELESDLVILSACRTATGRLSGDGIAGLSRALFNAGAASVMATQWDVADDPSARLMVSFYRNWRGGTDKRSALRAAQLEMIRALRAGTVVSRTELGTVRLREQPFFWAAYLMIGEP